MSSERTDECCPRFDPQPWDGTTITWEGKRFVKDRVINPAHSPELGKVQR